ncbi:MAG: CHAD domain-containing protein [Solirubrobacteraceae bacterium]|jgi:CHAD domain-containing protein
MKAAAVPGLSAEMPLAAAARCIVAARAGELFGFSAAALDERNKESLHDMRIAAKRLRYVLELIGFAIGEVAVEAELCARELQTLIGEIHDHDVLIARIESPTAASPGRGARRLALRLHSRRDALFIKFAALWATIEERGLHARIVAATSLSPSSVESGA